MVEIKLLGDPQISAHVKILGTSVVCIVNKILLQSHKS